MSTNLIEQHPYLEGLRPELLECLYDDEFRGPVVRHPLVFMSVPTMSTYASLTITSGAQPM